MIERPGMRTITLLTDFGLRDSYVAQMKGVIYSIAENVRIVDITHDVSPQNIEEGAFLLYTSIPYFPKDTIHLAVVDPGVGTSRKGIVIDCGDYILVGPDNGLLIPSAKRRKDFTVYEIKNRNILLDKITHTFHGRDVFAPVTAHIAKGMALEEVGEVIEDYVDLDLDLGKVLDNKIIGKIMHVDRFGNLVTNIEERIIEKFMRYGDEVDLVARNRRYRIRFLKSYGFAERGELFATIGGMGFLEISVNMGSAKERIGVNIGDGITLIL